MQNLIHNASALASAVPANLNTGLVDENRLRYHVNQSVSLAKAVKAMHERGEIEIAREIFKQYREQRAIAEALEARQGGT